MEYDHCMEILNLKEKELYEHYYCYNEKQEILDHIVIIGGTDIEIIKNL